MDLGEGEDENGDEGKGKGKGKEVDTSPEPTSPTLSTSPISPTTTTVKEEIEVGGTKSFANELIYAFWGKTEIPRGPGWKSILNRHRNYRIALAYPYTPGQSSMINRGPKSGGVQIVWHVRDPRNWIGVDGCTLRKDVRVVEVWRDDGTGTGTGTEKKGMTTKQLPPSYGVVFKAGPTLITPGCGGGGGGMAGVFGGGSGSKESGLVVKVNKSVPKLSHPVVMKPPEQPGGRFGSVILRRRSFMRCSSGHHSHGHGHGVLSRASNCSIGSGSGSGGGGGGAGGGVGPSPLSKSSLAGDDLTAKLGQASSLDDMRKSSSEKGGVRQVHVCDEHGIAMSVMEENDEEEEEEEEEDSGPCKSRKKSSSSCWKSSRIPVVIRNLQARSLTRSKSKVQQPSTDHHHHDEDGKRGGGGGGARFGKLVKKASKDVLGKRFFSSSSGSSSSRKAGCIG
ncbi:hypothetical protein QBC43DRAFT_304661 [Cladorrhinum sp. PSN259]|nr:hypothetical protein QBC43DRAFT_304661 [Cladorrhinum sp. PSN259]